MDIKTKVLVFRKELRKIIKICADQDNAISIIKKRRRRIIDKIDNLRRKQLLILMMLEQVPYPRVEWEKRRTRCFWERDCRLLSDEIFRSNFRMSRENFGKLCLILKNMDKQITQFRESIPLDKRVAVALYTLGSSSEYRSIANLFGIGVSTVCSIFLEFCEVVWRLLQPSYLNYFPLTAEKVTELLTGFGKLGFPQCIGVIDGCHIEVHPHTDDAADYFNCKGWYSTVILALVDYRYRFIYVNVGSPGRCNDSEIYEKSLLKQHLSSPIVQNFTQTIDNVNIPVHIIGDSAFKFSNNLMKPYPFSMDHTLQHENFNKSLSKCRKVVENAFGHMKARFRRIGKGLGNHVKNANKIVKACCVLHNFLSENNDEINKQWIVEQTIVEHEHHHPDEVFVTDDFVTDAEEIRSTLARYLCNLAEDGHGVTLE